MDTNMDLDPVMIEIVDACFRSRFTEVMSHCLLPAPVNKIGSVRLSQFITLFWFSKLKLLIYKNTMLQTATN